MAWWMSGGRSPWTLIKINHEDQWSALQPTVIIMMLVFIPFEYSSS